MNICARALCLSLAAVSPVWAVAPSEAEEKTEIAETAWAPPWKHKLGVRFGTAAFSRDSLGGVASLFYENQYDPNLALRYTLEISSAQYDFKDASRETTTVRRVGVALEGIHYGSESTHDGTGFYGLAGLGVHRIYVSENRGHEPWGRDMPWGRDTESTIIVPALSFGLGYHFGRSFGMEYKHTLSVSRSSTTFHEGTGEWGQLTLNIRFPAPGLPKGGWSPGKRTAASKAADGPPWKHKFGLGVGYTGGFYSGAARFFYENQFGAHWAIRPAIEITDGQEHYNSGVPVWGGGGSSSVDRLGAHMDCIYYLSNRRQDGTLPAGRAGRP